MGSVFFGRGTKEEGERGGVKKEGQENGSGGSKKCHQKNLKKNVTKIIYSKQGGESRDGGGGELKRIKRGGNRYWVLLDGRGCAKTILCGRKKKEMVKKKIGAGGLFLARKENENSRDQGGGEGRWLEKI